MRKATALFLVGFCVAVAVASEDKSVVTLTSDNFDQFIKENSVALVEFYAPWCGHCKRLAPEYEQAAKRLLEGETKVPLAMVDATAEDALARKFGVSGYPTLKFFRNGKPEDYKGGRTADTIVSWVEKMLGPSVEIVENKAAAEKEAKSVPVAFVGEFSSKDTAAYQTFEGVADSSRMLGKFIAFMDSAANGEVSVHRKGEGKCSTVTVDKAEDLEKFCSEERFPFFGPIDGENFGDYFSNGRELIWFAGSEEDYEEVGKAIREAAKGVRGKYNFVWLDTDKYKEHASSALAVRDFPALVMQSKDGRYIYPRQDFQDASKISEFIKDAEAGKIEKSLLSEPIPESNDETVKVVVGKTFEEIVLAEDKDVLLEVYAPWCGHCKKLEPIYAQFAEKMAPNKHLVVAKMDGTTNESPVPGFDWRGFPTIFFVKAGATSPVVFSGARTFEGLHDFVKELSSKPIVEAETEVKDEL